MNAEQLSQSVLDQMTCTPDAITSPVFSTAHNLISITTTKKLASSLPHPESTIPQLSSQEWQPVAKEKADIIMYLLTSEFSEGFLKKTGKALELIWSTQLNITINWGVLGQVRLIRPDCIVKGTKKPIRMWLLFIGTALIHQGLKKWCDLDA